MGRRIECKKHKTSLFLLNSESARTVIDDEPRMVLYQHSNRPEHDGIFLQSATSKRK